MCISRWFGLRFVVCLLVGCLLVYDCCFGLRDCLLVGCVLVFVLTGFLFVINCVASYLLCTKVLPDWMVERCLCWVMRRWWWCLRYGCFDLLVVWCYCACCWSLIVSVCSLAGCWVW